MKYFLVFLILCTLSFFRSISGVSYRTSVTRSTFSNVASNDFGLGGVNSWNLNTFQPYNASAKTSASVLVSYNSPSQALTGTNYGFDQIFGLVYIPDDIASADGIILNVQLSSNSDSSSASLINALLVQDNQPVGNTRAYGAVFGSSTQTITCAGSGWEDWNCSSCMTPASIKNSTSGIAIQVTGTYDHNNVLVSAWSLALTVWFTFSVSVNYVTPTAAPAADLSGGQLVTIVLGGDIVQVTTVQAIACEFGSNLGTVVRISAPTERPPYIICETPSQTAYGSYPVKITLDGTSWSWEYVLYTYPQTSSCTPPCSSNGICQLGACSCLTGWTGTQCTNPDCSIYNNCSGHGTCSAPETCSCDPGWGGLNCSQINCGYNCTFGTCVAPQTCSCNSDYVSNGEGGCMPYCPGCNGTNQFCVSPNNCICSPGFTNFPYCNVTSNFDCNKIGNCSNRGFCIQNNTCQCDPGWTSANCSQALCIDKGNCSNHGICVLPDVCSCDPGYIGANCQLLDCSSLADCNSINGGGTCIGPNLCKCAQGWKGLNCSTPICSVCNGLCVGPDICNCPSGTLPPLCGTIPSNACPNAKNCSGHGVCLGSDICVCDNGWEGYACDHAICIYNPCENGICISPEVCQCYEGYSGIQCEIQNSVPVVQGPQVISKNVVIIAAPIAAGLVVLILIFIIIIIVKYKSNKKKTSPIPIQPKYEGLCYGSAHEKLFYEGITERNFESFEKILLNLDFIEKLVDSVPVSEHEELANWIIFYYESQSKIIPLFERFIIAEINVSETGSTLFRGNSFCTKLFKSYSKLHGSKYLFVTLAGSITNLSHKVDEEQLEIEIDPHKVEDGASTSVNKWQLLFITQKLYSSIIRSISNMPNSLRYLSSIIYDQTNARYPDHATKALGGFWFLRFYCPALVAPHSYGLLPNPPSETLQRDLILLSKVLQNLANDVEFGTKEVGMESLNDFIKENRGSLEQFYHNLILKENPNERIEIPEKVRLNSLAYLYNATVTQKWTSSGLSPELEAQIQNLIQAGTPLTKKEEKNQ